MSSKNDNKNLGGRPPTFATVKDLQAKIDDYFDFCDNKTKKVHSEKLGDMILADPEPYTMSGLAYQLDVSRQTLINYEAKDKFLDTIKKARNRVEADVERRMNSKDTFTPGLIFNAKNNFGWKDQTEVDHTTKGKALPSPILGGITKDAIHSNNSTTETA